MRLKDVQVRNAKPLDKPYKLHDGMGMYLLVTPSGSKLWRWDYRYKGKRKTLSLGKYPTVSLEQARKLLLEMREILEKDVDPSEFRRVHKEEVKTFKDMAIEWFNMASSNWDKKYAEKTLGRIKNHLYQSSKVFYHSPFSLS